MFAVAAAAFWVVSPSHDTYATEVPVLFRITNHQAEVTADILSDGNKITVYDVFPDVRVRYKNAIRVSLNVEDSTNTLIESKTQAVDLSSTEKELTFDLSSVKVDPGDYYIKVSATNVDEEESEPKDLELSVSKEAPDVPNTGANDKNDIISAEDNAFITFGIIIVASIFVLAYGIKKGVLR
jgi:hypothetical protein